MDSLPLRRSRTVRLVNNNNSSSSNSSTITSSMTTALAMSMATRERPTTARRALAASRAAHDTFRLHGKDHHLCAYAYRPSHTDIATQQRVQAPQNQVQRPDAVPALRKPEPRVCLCAQLLQWFQRFARVQGYGGAHGLAAGAGQHAV